MRKKKTVAERLHEACKGLHVCFIGGPCACGKSTLTSITGKLLEPFGVMVLDTSVVIKEEILSKTRLGKAFLRNKQLSDQGGLQPDEETILAISKRIKEARKHCMLVIVIGTPRTETQAHIIIEAQIDYSAIHLKADQELLIRNLRRRVEEGRSDDVYFEGRMKIYEEKTVPAFSWLEIDQPNRYLEIPLGKPRDAVCSIAGVCLKWDNQRFGTVVQTLSRPNHPATRRILSLSHN